ncbi:MAG: hypothetical protein LBV33_05280 [Lachnospiraceae bacterium]|jgi:hypothetical protein|nr:hypothetical protein [Lachnospiraceae bacterium]
MINGINVTYVNLPPRVKSFVTQNYDMSYTIVLNCRASYEQNLISYNHELGHIYNGDYEKEEINLIENNAH